jgi:hypothetical protein
MHRRHMEHKTLRPQIKTTAAACRHGTPYMAEPLMRLMLFTDGVPNGLDVVEVPCDPVSLRLPEPWRADREGCCIWYSE